MRSNLAFFAMLALAGCATTYAQPLPAASTIAARPNMPSIYTQATRAPLHSELFSCGRWGSNLGEIGLRGEALNYSPYIQTAAGPLLRNPTESACLSSGYGWRGSDGGGRPHNGLDLANAQGGFIYAAGDGRITFADWRGGYGMAIEIDHGAGVRTLYAHLSEINPDLRVGQRIAAGEPIARMGATGNATGVHLHYEVSVDGLLVDPLHFGLPPQYVTTQVVDRTPLPLDDDK